MFLPISINEINEQGAEVPDIVLVTGDAYVDHPSYGAAIIGRLLQKEGYIVGVLPQPDWKDTDSFKIFGKPKLGFFVTGGNIDSMVNHYTAAKKPRSKDVYSPGGKIGFRPDRATIVYGNKIREAYKDIPIIIGGLEASLRRLAHYDYWDDKVRRSILADSSADLLIYGMGESPTVEIAKALRQGIHISQITDIRGTVYKTKEEPPANTIILPSYAEVSNNKEKYAESFKVQYENTDAVTAEVLAEKYDGFYIIQNKPALPLSTSELDKSYSYPYERNYHPMYEKDGGIPAIEEVKFSITNNRGCFGNCNFCALSFHQGRVVQARSHKSIMSEAEKLVWDKDFKGYIHDVGGPTANFRQPACEKQKTKGACKNKQCLFPKPCPSLKADHRDYVALLKKLRGLPNVKKVFIRSGIRFDYVLADGDDTFFNQLVKHHISGQLKVAPEHVSKDVLKQMGKPEISVFNKFKDKYYRLNEKYNKKQYLVPYFISSHPGCDLKEAVELAEYLRDNKINPQQVQDFYPTPGTLSTCMYHTEKNPLTGEKIYVAKNPRDKSMQRALLQYRLPQNRELVREALIKADRRDLIGFTDKCLIRPGNKAAWHEKPVDKREKEKQKSKKKTIRNVHKSKNK